MQDNRGNSIQTFRMIANIFSSNHFSFSLNSFSGPRHYLSHNSIGQEIQISEIATKSTSVYPSKHSPRISQFLGANEIHIWTASLNRDELFIENLHEFITKNEQIKADKFHFQKDQKNYIISHGLLRIILSRYLIQKPNQIQFSISKYGKPSLQNNPGDEILSFNMSHSADKVIYAITRNRMIGIDIERIVEVYPCEEIAENFFSTKENNELLKLEPGKPREIAFFTTWTRKEAYIKARGEGLSVPLDQFDVAVSKDEPAKLIANRMDPEEVTRWTLIDLKTSPGYVSTLAAEGSDLRISYREI